MADTPVAIVVPRRSDGGERDRLWEFARAYWEHLGWPIIEGHHDDGPFNRGAAINRAVAQADAEVYLIADGDVIADYDQARAAVQQAALTGRCTLAFDKYRALSRQMTTQVLDGYDGSWDSGARLKMDTHVSSLVAVPKALWDQVGGFDERFIGWGADDLAFAAACRVLAGGIDRIPGTVWHLHHDVSPERDKRLGHYRANHLLLSRYTDTVTPAAMRAFLDEPTDGVALMVLTNGRRGCISRTIPAAEQHLKGLPIVRRVIIDDSASIEYQAWLRLEFPDWDLVPTGKKKPAGFGGATRVLWDTAITQGQPWVFWLEDDYVIQRPVDLAAIAAVLDADHGLAQILLRRQPWFPKEIEAGGIIEQHPDQYTDRTNGTDHWVEHQLGYWTNPHLVSRRFLVDHEWPARSNSEHEFSRHIRRTHRSAFWETRTAEPLVTHIGERTGHGY